MIEWPLASLGVVESRGDLDAALAVLTSRGAGWTEHHRGVAAHLEQVARSLDDPQAIGRALCARAQVEYHVGDVEDVLALLAEAEPLVAQAGAPLDRVQHGGLRALAEIGRTGAAECATRLRALETDAGLLDVGADLAIYLNRRHIAELHSGDLDAALRSLFRALTIAEEVGEPSLLALILTNVGSYHHDAGNYDDALDIQREAMWLVETHHIVGLSVVGTNLATTLVELGEHGQAWEWLSSNLHEGAHGGDHDLWVYTQLVAAEVLLSRGDIGRARELIDAAADHIAAHDLYEEVAHLSRVRCELLLADERPVDALAALDDVDESAVSPGYRIDLRGTLARAAAAVGQWEVAYRALEERDVLVAEIRRSARGARLLARKIEREVRGLVAERDAALLAAEAAATARAEVQALNEQLAARLAEVEELRAEMAELAVRDPLTDLFNRRYFNEYMRELVGRPDAQFALAMVDLDHFKAVNDTHGHTTGDVVLRRAADHLRYCVRAGDLVCRYGGEEFCIVLHRVDSERGAHIIRGVLASYHELLIEHGDALITGLTFSAGVASYPADGTDVGELLKCADQAMYDVKRSTRNAVRVTNPPK